MKKLYKVITLVLLVSILFVSCATTAEQRLLAREIKAATADGEPRIICLAPNMVEVVYALGMGDYIVGWSAYTDYPPDIEQKEGWQPYAYYYYTDTQDFNLEEELARDVAVVSKFYDYNQKIVLALEPTIVFGYGTEQEAMCEELNGLGIPSYNYICNTIDDAYDMMIEVGDLLGVGKYARKLVEGYYAELAKIEYITETLPSVPVYFEIAHQADYGEWGVYGPYTEGNGTIFEDMIRIAGGKNIFGDVEGTYMEVSFKDIVERNPEVILSPYWPNALDDEVTTLYEIMTRDGFDTTDAVKHGRVYYYDSSLMKRFGPRTVTAIKKLAYLLHPYYFDNPENSVSPWELGKIDIYEDFPQALY